MSYEEEQCVLNIAMIGEAKSMFIQSIDEAEKGDCVLAKQSFHQAKELLRQASLVQFYECDDFQDKVLYLHMQNHMAATEIIEILASKLITLYQKEKG